MKKSKHLFMSSKEVNYLSFLSKAQNTQRANSTTKLWKQNSIQTNTQKDTTFIENNKKNHKRVLNQKYLLYRETVHCNV